jgi:hypothetical protein
MFNASSSLMRLLRPSQHHNSTQPSISSEKHSDI